HGLVEPNYLVDVFLREKPFRYDPELPGGCGQQQKSNNHDGKTVPHRPVQSDFVGVQHPLKHSFQRVVHSPVLLALRPSLSAFSQWWLKNPTEEHGGERKKNNAQNKDRKKNHNENPVQQAPKNPRHEEYGDKNCRERK